LPGTVRTLRILDIFGVFVFKTLAKNAAELGTRPFACDALRDLLGVDPKSGETFARYDLYFELTRRVLLIMPLWPLLAPGRALRVGPAV
jgi:hypothetical protein